MFDRFKGLFGGSAKPQLSGSGQPVHGRKFSATPFNRRSNGLDQFFSSLRERQDLSILDFAGASQENISFITSMGHRLSSEDFVRSLEHTFGAESPDAQSDPRLLDQFVRENLSFQPESFDAALVWDSLQFLSPHLLQITVDRLYETLRPGAHLLAFFNSDDKAREVPVFQYRIADQRTLMLTPRGFRPSGQFFNNRAIEKLFHRYSSVKFFLARDHLREILVKR